MKESWINLGQDYVHMDSYGSITAIIKPVRNQVTGEIQRPLYDAHIHLYDIMGKPPDSNKTA